MAKTHLTRHRGWVLVDTTHGWVAAKGAETIYVGRSTFDVSKELKARFERVVDEREDGIRRSVR